MRRRHYDLPHDVYVLADPRTGVIRYVGRTVHGTEYRFDRHVQQARGGSYPLHRWMRRLRARELAPLVACVAKEVEYSYETDLCEALVHLGVPLLNVTPSYARTCGRVTVDAERLGRRLMEGDVVHLSIPIESKGDEDDFVASAAASAFRRMADLLDPPKSTSRSSQYEHEMALYLAHRIVHLVVDGVARQSPLGAALEGPRSRDEVPLLREAKEAVAIARASARSHGAEQAKATRSSVRRFSQSPSGRQRR